MAQPTKPKTMSSRLATMKFMQRAAPTPSSPDTPEPPAKKQRMSNGAVYSSPAEASAEQDSSLHNDKEDTKWYLSYKQPDMPPAQTPLRIVSAGYSLLDAGGAKGHTGEAEDAQPTRPSIVGRRSFGRFNKVIEKQQNPDMSSSDSASDSDSEDESSEEDEEDDPTGANAMIKQARKEAGDKARAQRKANKKEEKAQAARLAEERRKKHVKLNQLSSISGNTGPSNSPACHVCGQKGHLKRDCPRARKR